LINGLQFAILPKESTSALAALVHQQIDLRCYPIHARRRACFLAQLSQNFRRHPIGVLEMEAGYREPTLSGLPVISMAMAKPT
jgi:hypothetical protein